MKLSYLMIFKAAIVAVFGICFVLIPIGAASLFGITLNEDGALITQLFGASFILLGIILWFARNAPSSEIALRAIVLAVFIGDALGFIISLMAQFSGNTNALGWFVVLMYLLLTAGFGYFQFSKPAKS